MYLATTKVFVLGGGGFSKEVQWLIDETPHFEFEEFVDKGQELKFHALLRKYPNEIFYAAMGVGTPEVIVKILNTFIQYKNLQWPTIIHPSVLGDFPNITFGAGCIVCAGNVMTTDISIGEFNVLNLNSTLGHDLRTGAFCVINPNSSTSANVTLEGQNLVGVGSTLLANTTMHTGAVLGAGAVLTKDIPAGEVWAGVPAKRFGDWD